MTKLQRCVLLAVAGFVVLAGLYVPFEYVDNGERYSVGYSWIFAPSDDEAVVNTSQVFFAWLGALLVGGILWLAAKPGDGKEGIERKQLETFKVDLLADDATRDNFTLRGNEQQIDPTIAIVKRFGHSVLKFVMWTLGILAFLVFAVLGKEIARALFQ